MKIKSLLFLIAVSMAVLCILTCGCTAQDGTSNRDTAEPGSQEFNPGEMSAGDGNMTAPQGGGGPGGMGRGMDLAAAAEALGVTEDELSAALGTGEESGEPMDLESAAATLGVTVEELQDALGMGDMPKGGMSFRWMVTLCRSSPRRRSSW